MLIGLGQLPVVKAAQVVGPAVSQAEPAQPGDSLTEAQVKQYSNDPRLLTVALWAQNPDEAAKLEATALMTALEALKGEAVPLAKELQQITQTVAEKRASVQRMRAEIAVLSRQGMGEILAIEREAGVFVDPFMAGIMSSVRKGFKDIDKAVIRPWSQPLDAGLKTFEKVALRPWSSPLHDGLKQLDRWVIRPWSVPLNNTLKKIDKYTIRPAAREVGKGIAVLDKFVPGWTMLLDFIAPIPLGTILGALAGKSLLSTVAGRVFPGSELIGNLAKAGDQSLNQAFSSAKSITSSPLGRTLPLTLAKGTHTFISTKGPFLTKLRATATEAVSGFALVLTVAATVVSFGTATPAMLAALSGLQALNAGLQSGINVLNANEAAKALKKQARAIRAAGNAELAKIEEEERQTLAEIAKLRTNIEAIKRQRMMIVRQSLAPASLDTGVVAQAAESIGVSETTLIVGGLVLIGGVVIIVSARS